MIQEECHLTEMFSLEKAWKLSKSWKRAALIWRTLDHLFVIGSFAASVSVIYICSDGNIAQEVVILLSSVAAILTLVSFACRPTRYMQNYRIAFELLNESLVLNTDTSGCFSKRESSWKEVVEAVRQGEKYIGKTFKD